MTTTKITPKQLAEILCNITRSTVCNVTYLVDDSRSITIKGIKQVQKLVNISNVYLNHDYTKKVINLSGNTNFVAQELKGKTRICSTLIQSDTTNELMIDGKVLKSEAVTILGFYHNGNQIFEAEAHDNGLWANSYYKPSEKQTMGRGTVSVEDDFNIINTYLKRIVYIKLEGTMYEIV